MLGMQDETGHVVAPAEPYQRIVIVFQSTPGNRRQKIDKVPPDSV
jgi:hypothetical protein